MFACIVNFNEHMLCSWIFKVIGVGYISVLIDDVNSCYILLLYNHIFVSVQACLVLCAYLLHTCLNSRSATSIRCSLHLCILFLFQ